MAGFFLPAGEPPPPQVCSVLGVNPIRPDAEMSAAPKQRRPYPGMRGTANFKL
jgi:hypothetical protein